MLRNPLNRIPLVLAGVSLAIGLVSCSTPPSGEVDGHDPALQSQTDEQAFDAWKLTFDSCMQREGIDISTNNQAFEDEGDVPDDDAPGEAVAAPAPGGFAPGAIKAAEKHCIDEVGNAPTREGSLTEQEQQDAMLVFARCMREAGYDFPDPNPAGGVIELGDGTTVPDPADVKKCGVKAGHSGARP